MSKTLKHILLTIALCILCSCENFLPGLTDSDRRVTLTLNTDLTKTMLVNDEQVLWQYGDRICINGKMYYIAQDSTDLSCAKVYDVVEAEEYYAVYAFSYEDMTMDGYTVNGCHLLRGQTYVKDGFGQYMNPMVGYSTSTSIMMHNMASILKMGIIGDYNITHLSVTGPNIMAGELKLLIDSVANGEYDAYITNSENTVYLEFGIDPISTEGLKYFYFVVAPQHHKDGIVVTMVDDQNNVYIQSTFNEVQFKRSQIKEMEEFSFKKAESINISVNNVTHDAVEYEINGEPGGIILSRVITKDKYAHYKAEGKLDELFANFSDVCTFHRTDGQGILRKTSTSLDNETEYMIIARYGNSLHGFGKIYTAEFTTETAPVIEEEKPVISWTSNNSFDSPSFNLKLGENVTGLRYTYMKDLVYSNMRSDLGMSDTDILNKKCRNLSESDIQLAKTDSYTLQLSNISYSIESDYIFLFEVTLNDGSSVIEHDMRRFDNTKYNEYHWQEISSNAEIEIGDFIFGDIHIEKAAGKEIYKILNFNPEESLYVSTSYENFQFGFTGNFQIILDATDPNSVVIVSPYTYLSMYRENEEGYMYPIYIYPYTSKNGTFDGRTFSYTNLRFSEERQMGSFANLYAFNKFIVDLNVEISTDRGVYTESFIKEPTKTSW